MFTYSSNEDTPFSKSHWLSAASETAWRSAKRNASRTAELQFMRGSGLDSDDDDGAAFYPDTVSDADEDVASDVAAVAGNNPADVNYTI